VEPLGSDKIQSTSQSPPKHNRPSSKRSNLQRSENRGRWRFDRRFPSLVPRRERGGPAGPNERLQGRHEPPSVSTAHAGELILSDKMPPPWPASILPDLQIRQRDGGYGDWLKILCVALPGGQYRMPRKARISGPRFSTSRGGWKDE
jgi:hypothetical protein